MYNFISYLNGSYVIVNKRMIIILALVMSLRPVYTCAQDTSFKASGNPVFLLFSNVNTRLSGGEHSAAFELSRLYLGYEYFFTKKLSARANIDIGDPGMGDLEMTAFVKNAYLQYKSGILSGRFGMISTDQFDIQEEHWGYRYIQKTVQDEFGFGPSSDLGVAVGYSPFKFISADISLLNGEGYKKLQSDSILKGTLGITLRPADYLIIRGYTDVMQDQVTFVFFAGITLGEFKAGLEYASQENNQMIAHNDFSGFSVFSSFRFEKKFSVFARFDKVDSEIITGNIHPWNFQNDGRFFLAGMDYSPFEGIRIAPVWKGWSPADESASFSSTLAIHIEIRL